MLSSESSVSFGAGIITPSGLHEHERNGTYSGDLAYFMLIIEPSSLRGHLVSYTNLEI